MEIERHIETSCLTNCQMAQKSEVSSEKRPQSYVLQMLVGLKCYI